MVDVLIRGLSEATVARIDSEAARLGLSRNAFLQRKLSQGVPDVDKPLLTDFDWVRSASVFMDLADSDVMERAWR